MCSATLSRPADDEIAYRDYERSVLAMLANERSVRLATRGKALADSTRLILLQLLRDADRALPVGDLALLADREQSGVSRHLRVLYETGLLDRSYRSRRTNYEINAEGKRLLAALFEADGES